MLDGLPLARTVKDQNRFYRAAKNAREPYGIVESRGSRSWSVVFDLITAERPTITGPIKTTWPRREARLLNRFVDALFAQRRITTGGYAPCEYFSLGSFSTPREAQVALAVVGDCYVGNPASAVRAIETLEGREDPVHLGHNPESGYPDRLAAGWIEPRTMKWSA